MMVRVGMTMHTAMTAASLSPLNTGSVSDCCVGNVNDAVGRRCDVDEPSIGGLDRQVNWVVWLDEVLVSLYAPMGSLNRKI